MCGFGGSGEAGGDMTTAKSLSEKVKLLPSHDLQGLLNVLAETHRDWFPAGFGRLEVTDENHSC